MSTIIDQIYDQITPVGELVFKDEYRNEKLVSELIGRSKQISSPLVASKVGWFITMVAQFRQDLVTSVPIRGIIVESLKKYATTAESVQKVGGTIAIITCCNPEGQRLFSR